MKNVYKNVLLILMAPLLLFSCKEEEVTVENPSIVFTTTRASMKNIDLDKAAGPNIRGWAVAPAGLAQVTVTADNANGAEEILNISSFNNENSEKNGTAYNFNVLPVYTSDFKGITVTVVDKSNRTEQLVFEVAATGGESGPVIDVTPKGSIEANVRPSVNFKPAIKGTVKSHFGLSSVTLSEVYGETVVELNNVTDFGSTPNEYAVNVTPDYDKGYEQGMTGFRIIGVDKRGFQRVMEIPVTVIDASAAPRVTFDVEKVEADLTVNPEVRPAITGLVNAFDGLASVKLFVVGPGGEIALGEEITTFENPGSYEINIEDFPYDLGVRGLKVEVKDLSDQVTTEILPVEVIAEDPDLVVLTNVVANAQGNREKDGILTGVSTKDGLVHHLTSPVGNETLAKTIDFIPTDPGGADAYDLFAPANTSWLPNNYFKAVEWPHYNATKFRVLDEGEVDFALATSLDIEGLSIEGFVDRARNIADKVVLFETEAGKKGLISLKSVNTNADAGTKMDIFTFDIKVIK